MNSLKIYRLIYKPISMLLLVLFSINIIASSMEFAVEENSSELFELLDLENENNSEDDSSDLDDFLFISTNRLTLSFNYKKSVLHQLDVDLTRFKTKFKKIPSPPPEIN